MTYLFIASMDIPRAHEALFNEVYDAEHLPALSSVPGVLAAHRYVAQPFDLSIEGSVHHVGAASPRYVAMYELEGPEILVSERWAAASEAGRWPDEVRPLTSNRSHVVLRELDH